MKVLRRLLKSLSLSIESIACRGKRNNMMEAARETKDQKMRKSLVSVARWYNHWSIYTKLVGRGWRQGKEGRLLSQKADAFEKALGFR